jgi:hypothetical protein
MDVYDTSPTTEEDAMRNWLWAKTISSILATVSPCALLGQNPSANNDVSTSSLLIDSKEDRPTELPNLIPAPNQPLQKKEPIPFPKTDNRGKPGNRIAEYDPTYNYLPETNPGTRQPPCPCLPLGKFWVDAGYFLGTTKSDTVPPLVAAGGNGVLGNPGVQTVSGDSGLTHQFRSGLKIETGLWLDRCQNWGIETHFFIIESSSFGFNTSSSGQTTLSRPFSDGYGTATARIIAGRGIGSGFVSVTSPLEYLGGDVNSRHTLLCEDQYRIDFVVGYRYLSLDESLAIQSTSHRFNGIVQDIRDEFATNNQFHAGQIGLLTEYRLERFYLNAGSKVAFGRNWSELNINGATRTRQANGVVVLNPSGVLTGISNSGETTDNAYGIVSDTNFTFGFKVTDFCRTFVGYSFLYASNLTRPGQAIDTTVTLNPVQNQRPHARPLRLEPNGDFWIQGINFGLEVRY